LNPHIFKSDQRIFLNQGEISHKGRDHSLLQVEFLINQRWESSTKEVSTNHNMRYHAAAVRPVLCIAPVHEYPSNKNEMAENEIDSKIETLAHVYLFGRRACARLCF